MSKHLVSVLATAVLALSAQFAVADETAIRKSIAERLPDFPKIDEVSKTPIPGIYERNGKYVDPSRLRMPSGMPIAKAQVPAFRAARDARLAELAGQRRVADGE